MASSDRLQQSPRDGPGSEPPTCAPSAGVASATKTLELLAAATAELANARDLYALVEILAQQLADLASATCATVWLTDQATPGRLWLAAAWPHDPPSAFAESRAEDLWLMHDAFAAGHARPAGDGRSSTEASLGGQPDAPLWVVPLGTSEARLGVAYLVAAHTATQAEHVSQALTILARQAAGLLAKLQARDAARADDAKFLAIAAHDLKNTATSIKGYTQLLRRNLPAEAGPRSARYAAAVEEQVGLLADALVALVDYGRVQSGCLPLKRERLDLRALLETVAADLPPAEGAAAVAPSIPVEPLVGEWDGARLQRALAAILESLRRASNADGFLQVTLRAVECGAELRVGAEQDDGVEPNAWDDGADLGLYLARGLVETHGGTLSYRRTPEGEPMLRLRLPLGESATPRVRAAGGEP